MPFSNVALPFKNVQKYLSFPVYKILFFSILVAFFVLRNTFSAILLIAHRKFELPLFSELRSFSRELKLLIILLSPFKINDQ